MAPDEILFLYPATRWYYVVCLSVCPSVVGPSIFLFPDDNLSYMSMDFPGPLGEPLKPLKTFNFVEIL